MYEELKESVSHMDEKQRKNIAQMFGLPGHSAAAILRAAADDEDIAEKVLQY